MGKIIIDSKNCKPEEKSFTTHSKLIGGAIGKSIAIMIRFCTEKEFMDYL